MIDIIVNHTNNVTAKFNFLRLLAKISNKIIENLNCFSATINRFAYNQQINL